MVLTRLTLTNWRTHKDLTVSLTPGVNAIVGPNDSGKTNILRALRFLLLNDGGTFQAVVSPGAKEARVEGEWDSGLVIARVRRSKVNRYIIRDPGVSEEDALVLDRVGNDPVPEVYQRTGVLPAGPEGLELAWQGVGYPSPLDMTPKALAGVLGRLSGAEAVEVAAAHSGAKYRDLGQRLRQAEETRDRATQARDALAGAKALPALVTAVEETEGAYAAATQRETTLLGLQTRLVGIPPQVDPALLATAGEALQAAENAGRSYAGHEARERTLRRLLASIPPECDTSALGPSLAAAEQAGEVYRAAEGRVAALNSLQVRHRQAVEALALSTQAAEREAKNFAEALAAYEVCPLCGSHLGGTSCPTQ